MSDLEEEARSTDGSDSEGSLVDFITKYNSDEEEEEEEEEVEEDNRDEATQLIEDFPFDRSLLEEDNNTSGLRRSRRQRKQTTRYVDPDNYNKLMFGDVDEYALSSSEDEKQNEEDDFVVDDMEDSTDDDEEEEEEEEKPAKKRKISSKITTTPDTKTNKKWDHMKLC